MDMCSQMQIDSPDEIAQIEGALASTRRAGGGEKEADGAEDGGNEGGSNIR